MGPSTPSPGPRAEQVKAKPLHPRLPAVVAAACLGAFFLSPLPALVRGQAFFDGMQGTFIGDRLGEALAGIPDVDGDGTDDLLVGVPGFDGNGTDSGLVLLLSGQSLSLHAYAMGPSAHAALGSAVTAVPDTDGDGVWDFAAGAPGYENGGDTGMVYLYSGADGHLLHFAAGSHPGASLGASLASGFDVDGDGKGDVAAGAPGYTTGGLTQCGAVRLFSGADMSELFLAHGFAAYDQLGRSVALTPDLDGDQVPDCAAGMPGYDPAAHPAAGGAALFSGASGSLAAVYEGPVDMGGFGAALAVLPDLNGDTHPEILSGGPSTQVDTHYNAGMVAFYSGTASQPYQTWGGVLSNQFFGRALCAAGRFDPDGVMDIAVGMQRPFTGGSSSGAVRVYSGATGTLLAELLPEPSGEGFGKAVAPAGDQDGDGYEDLVVGDPDSDASATDAGEIRIHLGSRPELTLVTSGQIGTPLGVRLRAFPGDASLIMADFSNGPTITPFVEFDLGFTPSMIFFPILPIPAEGLLSLDFTIPNDPGLVNLTLYFQALLHHAVTGTYLISTPASVTFQP